VSSTRFQALDAIVACLATDVAAPDRRQALLVLNNLCIPAENKRTILLGPARDEILSALLQILRNKLSECHLAVACLFNLSFYEETKSMLLHYVAPVDLKHSENETPEQYSFSKPTEKKDSMLRILEAVVNEFVPYFVEHRNSLKHVDPKKQGASRPSLEEATLRWTMCLLRNLATVSDHAVLLAESTSFPMATLRILEAVADDTDLSLWSHDSLPEACLVFWVWLVEASDDTCQYLQQNYGAGTELSAIRILEPITTQPGIQGIRAKRVAGQLLQSFGADEAGAASMASF
jgi:hypothetical protein